MTADEFVQYLQRLVDQAGSQDALATRLGISLPYLNDILRRRRAPGPKVLEPLGFQRVVTYERRNHD